MAISCIRYIDRFRFLNSGKKIGIDFQTPVPSWYIDGSNFCFEARYKSNQDFGAPGAPLYPNVHGVNPRGLNRSIFHLTQDCGGAIIQACMLLSVSKFPILTDKSLKITLLPRKSEEV